MPEAPEGRARSWASLFPRAILVVYLAIGIFVAFRGSVFMVLVMIAAGVAVVPQLRAAGRPL